MRAPAAVAAVHPVELGAQLRQVVWTDDALALLGGCGWNDGGCLVLARALSRVIGDRPHRLVAVVGTATPWVQHALVAVNGPDGRWFLDADDAATEAILIRRWTTVERIAGAHVVDLDTAPLWPDTCTDPAMVNAVAAYLRPRLRIAAGFPGRPDVDMIGGRR